MKTYIGTTKQIYKEFVADNQAGEYKKDKKYVCEIKELKGEKTAEQRQRYWATLREYVKLKQQAGMKITDLMEHKQQLKELSIYKKDSNGDYIIRLLKPHTDYRTYEEAHISPTNSVVKDKNGNDMQVFLELKKSEDFTTEEYSRLIDNLHSNIEQDGLDNEINIYNMGD